VKWVHIPYKGGGPGLIALLSGEVSLYFGNMPTVIRQARAGKLRALAVTGARRARPHRTSRPSRKAGCPVTT
jgi:tripartite-type tricarboxylate transporter receptor subunit TctC